MLTLGRPNYQQNGNWGKLSCQKINFLSLIVKILVKALLMITYADTRRDTTLLEHQELDPYFGLDIELDNTYEILR